ncbi:hypothetical protein [Mammaliicoccus vitulinus]|uniref:hypothetical protein n=1 Tax=Mammaliicoccus vitulinus TaxID=71237 RepID=UPI00248B91C7|nr:hypothetical protein [Mammaliicoccus vitulinus]
MPQYAAPQYGAPQYGMGYNNGYVPYNPGYTNPQQGYMPTNQALPQQPTMPYTPPHSLGLFYVKGLEGANTYFVTPNTNVFLMDLDNPYLYKKTADMAGNTRLEKYKLVLETDDMPIEQGTHIVNQDSRINSIEQKLDTLLAYFNKNVVSENKEVNKENA